MDRIDQAILEAFSPMRILGKGAEYYEYLESGITSGASWYVETRAEIVTYILDMDRQTKFLGTRDDLRRILAPTMH